VGSGLKNQEIKMKSIVSIWDRLDFFEGRSDLYDTIEKQAVLCLRGRFVE